MNTLVKRMAAAIGLALCSVTVTQAASATWDGGGTNAFWNTATNWAPNAVPVPATDSDLLFGGAIRLINTNDFTAGSNFRNIIFNNTAGAFTLTGNAITLSGGVTNNDGNNQTINLDMTFPGIQTVNAAAGNIILGGSISGAGGGLIKSGANTLTLTGANTYDGSTTISAGILQIGTGGTSGTLGSGDVINNAVLTFNRSDDLTANNAISGTGSLTKLGAGTLTLGGANSYTGATTVSVGAMRILQSDALGTAAGGVTVASGAALDLENNIAVGAEALSLNGTGISNGGALRNISGDNSWAGAITLANATRINSDSGTLTIDVASGNAITGTADNLTVGGAGNVSINDAIATTTGTLTKDGSGTLTLAGNNTYSGITTISSGTLQVGNGGTSGTLGTGNVVNNAALVVNRSNAITVSNAISGTGSLTKTGAGTMTLTRSNTFSGATTINEGTLAAANALALQNSTLNYNAGGGAMVFGATNSAFTLGGLAGDKGLALINSDGAAIALTVGNNNSDTTYSGVLSDGGSLIKTGTGILTLGGANTYSGNTDINGGMLRLNNANALGGGNLNISGGLLGLGADDFTRSLGTGAGMVQLNGNSGFAAYGADRLVNLNNDLSTLTWGGTADFLTLGESLILGAGDANATVDFQNSIALNGAVRTVQVNEGTAAVDARLSGVLSGDAGGLNKTGTGTLELTTNNTYTGATTVSAGALRILQADALGTTAGGTTVSNGAALELKNNIAVGAEALSLNGTGISGGGALRNLSGNNSWAGTVTLTNVTGVHRINSDADTLTITGGITESGGLNKNLTFGGAGDVTVNGNITTDIASDLQLTKDGKGTLILNGTTNNYGITTISDGTLQVGTGGITGTLGSGNVVNDAALVINRSDALTAGNLISGTGSLTKSGAGVLTLTGANTFSGLTTISDGTLQVGNGGTIGSLGSGNVENNAELVFNRSNAITVSNRISGTGSLIKSGAGTTTLTGANTYDGSTMINAGTLQVGAGGTSGTLGSGDVINNAVLAFNRSDDLTVNNAIGGTGSLTKSGAGRAILGGANSYTGSTTVSVGAIRALHSDALGTTDGGTTVATGTALELGNNIAVGAEALSLIGTGITNGGALRNISGDNSWAGAITLGGATRINSDSGTLTIDVASGNAIIGTGDNLTFGGAGNVSINDAIATTSGTLTKDGAGTLTLAGANTYSGATTISGGTLQVGNGGTSGTLGIGNVINNSTLVINRSNAITVSNVISGSGTLVKSGAGTLTLTRANTYTNTTTVTSGKLIVDGNLQSKQIVVSSGALLDGTGTVQSVTMDAGSILAAGKSPGTMTFNGALMLSAGSTNIMEILSASLYDVLKGTAASALTAEGVFSFDFSGNTTVTNGSTFAVLQSWGSVTMNGATFTATGMASGLSLDTSKLASTGFVTVVPEPAALGLLCFGAVVSILTNHLRCWSRHR